MGVAPVRVALFTLLVHVLGAEFTVLAFTPLPFVFVAATAGYAISDLDFLGGFWSVLLASGYGFTLAVTEVR